MLAKLKKQYFLVSLLIAKRISFKIYNFCWSKLETGILLFERIFQLNLKINYFFYL